MLSAQTHLVARYLDLLSQSQRLTATNIANVDTPGFKTLGMDFQAELRTAMDDPKHAPVSPIRIREVGGGPVKNDGNDVSLDRELSDLSETAVRFNHALLMLRGGIGSVRKAIQEGRGG